MVSAESSSSPLAASAKWIPCFVTFALALTGSYSQSTIRWYAQMYTARQ